MNKPDTALTLFESAWKKGETPEIADFLKAENASFDLAMEFVALDIEYRWKQMAKWASDSESVATAAGPINASPFLEEYVKHLPQIQSVDELPVNLIAHEFYVRTKWGDHPPAESYEKRFPNQYQEFRAGLNNKQSNKPPNEDKTLGPAQDSQATTFVRETREHAQTVMPESAKRKRNRPQPKSLKEGDLPNPFGRYKILKRLGRGGMGAVYLAEDPDLERKVAIKVPFFEPGDGASVLDRFRREAKSIATLHHPNICPVFEVAEKDGIHYMAMAFIEGKPLSSYVREGKGQEIRSAVLLVRKIALALHDAHLKGVIHRDLKPDNIMIDRRKEPIIMDFGLARREGKADTELTAAGQMMGTPNYMPPEQVAGRLEEMGPGCDIYSLGVILYQLISGQIPFKGDMLALLTQIATEAPTPPSTHRPEIDQQLDALCLKAMEKKPADRYQSMEEFALALADYAKGLANSGKEQLESNANPEKEESNPFAFISTEGPKPSPVGQTPVVRAAPQTPSQKANQKKLGPLIAIAGGSFALLLLVIAVIAFGGGGDGTMRVEILDPDIEVAVKGTDIVLRQADQDKDFELRPGEKTLVVSQGNIEFETDAIELVKGKKVVIQVKLLPGEIRAMHGDQVVGRKQLPPQKRQIVKKDPQKDTKMDLVGSYQDDPPGNDWHYVVIQKEFDGSLTWNNAGGASWKILLKENRYWSGPNCPYGELELKPEQDKNGTVTAIGFGGAIFTRNPNAAKVVAERRKGATAANNDPIAIAANSSFPEGYFYLTTEAAESKGLVLESSPITLIKRGNFNGMFWKAFPAEESSPGFHELTSFYFENRKMVLEGSDGSEAIMMLERSGVTGTLWKAVPAGEGYFHLTTMHMEKEGKVLDGNVGFEAGEDATFQGQPFMTDKRSASTRWKFVRLENQPLNKPPLAVAPYNLQTAKDHQRGWANYLGLPVEKEVALPDGKKIKMVFVPPGELIMGNDGDETSPKHGIRITQPFYMSKFEITQDLWTSLMETTPWKGQKLASEGANLSATFVNWNDVQSFLKKLNQLRVLDHFTFGIPTEAQWEHACRAGTTGDYTVEVKDLPKVAWCLANSGGKPNNVGKLAANPFGLYDMHGNVWEWCSDWYAKDYYVNSPVEDPTGPVNGEFMVIRGGGWDVHKGYARSAYRGKFGRNISSCALGFRVIAFPSVLQKANR